jgi:hypothetical protein
MTIVAEKKQPSFAVFRAKQKLTPLHLGPPGRGRLAFVLSTGAEVEALAATDGARHLVGYILTRGYWCYENSSRIV